MLRTIISQSRRALTTRELQFNKTMAAGRSLQNIVSVLEKFAPLNYAEKWDNVGLIIEPVKQRPIKKIMLTNDLTELVMAEALLAEVEMIISYHPPIFAPLKRITQNTWKERIIATCLAESISVYSPHTAWDAVSGGVNDWLCSALPRENIKPIQFNPSLPADVGMGRCFSTAVTLREAISNLQQHIGLDVHVAMGVKHDLDTLIRKVAVCAGSGSSLLMNVQADLYITGEMSHHNVLDANHQNISVILCNHSNSERGFLNLFQSKLKAMVNDDCEVIVSTKDADPLKTFVKS